MKNIFLLITLKSKFAYKFHSNQSFAIFVRQDQSEIVITRWGDSLIQIKKLGIFSQKKE